PRGSRAWQALRQSTLGPGFTTRPGPGPSTGVPGSAQEGPGAGSGRSLRAELVRLVEVVRPVLELASKLGDGSLERLDLVVGCLPLGRHGSRGAGSCSLVIEAALQFLKMLVDLVGVVHQLLLHLRVDLRLRLRRLRVPRDGALLGKRDTGDQENEKR